MNTNTNTIINNKIDLLIKDNKIFRFAIELQHTTDEDRKQLLKEILQSYQTSQTAIPDHEKAKQKLDILYDKFDENALKRKWHKLTDDQKIDRIKVFLLATIQNEIEREQHFKTLQALLEAKKLKPIHIDYDTTTGKIIAINYQEKKSRPKDDV